MSVENQPPDPSFEDLEKEAANRKFCILYVPDWTSESKPSEYKVNPRHNLDAALILNSQEISESVKNELVKKRGFGYSPVEPKQDPLEKLYREKFWKRAIQKKGFGVFDAYQVMFEDGWEIVIPLGRDGIGSYFLLKRRGNK